MLTKEKVISVMAEMLGVKETSITEESLIVDLAHDSIKLFELFVRFEKELGTDLTYEEVAHIESVADIFAFIETHTNSQHMKTTKVESYTR